MESMYGQGDWGFFSKNVNLFSLALLEFFWKLFTLVVIFRSIQYIRYYRLRQEIHPTKLTSIDNQSSIILFSHVLPTKQFDV